MSRVALGMLSHGMAMHNLRPLDLPLCGVIVVRELDTIVDPRSLV